MNKNFNAVLSWGLGHYLIVNLNNELIINTFSSGMVLIKLFS